MPWPDGLRRSARRAAWATGGRMCRFFCLFGGGEHAADDGGIQLVLALDHFAGIVLYPQDEHGQHAFLIEVLVRNRDGEDAEELALAVGGFVAMAFDVPGEDANL